MTEKRSQGRPKAARTQGRPTAAETQAIRATVIQALLDGHTIKNTADLASVTTETIHKMLHHPDVLQALETGAELQWEQTKRIIKGRVPHAFTIITNVMAKETTTDANRLRAAQLMLDAMWKLQETDTSTEFAELKAAQERIMQAQGLHAVQ